MLMVNSQIICFPFQSPQKMCADVEIILSTLEIFSFERNTTLQKEKKKYIRFRNSEANDFCFSKHSGLLEVNWI